MIDWQFTKEQILSECREDHVGLWSIIQRVRELRAEESFDVTESTLILVTQPLSENQIIARQFERTRHSAGGFEFVNWEISPHDSVARIKREWVELSRDPNLGEIVWLTAKASPGR